MLGLPAAMRRLLAGLLLALLPAGLSTPAQLLGAASWRTRAGGYRPPSLVKRAGVQGPPRELCGPTAAGVRRCAKRRCAGSGSSPSAGRTRGPGAAYGERKRGSV